jgi:FlaA1/EpsC-like NDP-sugar epimerase
MDYAELIDRMEIQPDGDWMRSLFQCRRVLVTGAGGTIGSEICRLAAKHGASAIGLMERAENALFEIHRTIGPRGVPILHDCTSLETVSQMTHFSPDLVFHTAAYKHVPMMEGMPHHAILNNIIGTERVLSAACVSGATRFVFVSTDKAVNPTSIMGMSKRVAERVVWNHPGDIMRTVVRLGNVLGSAGSVLDIWDRQAAAGERFTITDPNATRYFVTIGEAAAVVSQAATNHASGPGVYVPSMGKPVRMGAMLGRYAKMRGIRAKSKVSGLRPGEKLHEEITDHGAEPQATNHPAVRFYATQEPGFDFGEVMATFCDAKSSRDMLVRYAVAGDLADITRTPTGGGGRLRSSMTGIVQGDRARHTVAV